MKVTLFGSTGLVGKQLLEQLINESQIQSIENVVRRSVQQSNPKVHEHLWIQSELPPSLFQSDILFCCLGTTIKKAGTQEAFRAVDYQLPLLLAKQFKACGGQHFIVISSQGADQKSKVFYNRTKGEMERDLIALKLPQLTIVRPSLLLGDRKESRPGEALGRFISPLLIPLMPGPLKKYRPITDSEVARAMTQISLGKEPKTMMEFKTYFATN